MVDREFHIYVDRNKLQESSVDIEYRVENLMKSEELIPFIKAFTRELEIKGLLSIYKNFDKLFSVIEYIDQINYLNLHDFYEKILVKSFNSIESCILNYDNIEDIPLDIMHQLRNIIKMSVYLFVEFVQSFNKKIDDDYKLIILETKGKNKKQDMVQKHASDYDWNWEDKLSDGLKAINSIISNDINQLNDPPYVDHTLISYIASCCYTLLQNVSITFVRTKCLRDSITKLLMVLITDYNHDQQFKTKMVELLKSYEHLALLFAKIVIKIVQSKASRSSLIEIIVKEIAETGKVESCKDLSNHGVNGGKSCCIFLVEIAKHCPNIVLPSIEYLLPCLESDPYTMRICVLSVLKEIILNVLSNDELDELRQNTRDKYLSILQDHLLDTNAFVRSKTLQLWIALIKENCLPKFKYLTILKCTNEKLHDKSSYVTKSAIQLIKTLIKLNPYCSDFTENILKEKLEEKHLTYNYMKQVLEKKIQGTLTSDETWSFIKPQLRLFLAENIEGRSIKKDETDNCLQFPDEPMETMEEHVLKNAELPEVLNKIKGLITLCEFESATKLLLLGRETFKDEPLFKIQDEENLVSDQFFTIFKNIWRSEKTITPNPMKNPETPKPMNNPEIDKLTAEELSHKILLVESKIQYLQECIEYSSVIKTALVRIDQLMFENTTSESLEAISFFETAYFFGIPNAQIGINSMLTLIQSSDTNVKEAMLNTYGKIYLNFEEDKNSSAIKPVMTKILNLLKTLNVTYINAFKTLLDEWIKNNSLNNDCIMMLWAWFTKTEQISQEDRTVVSHLISLLASVKPSIAKANLDNLIKHGLYDDYKIFIYTCHALEQISYEDFDRFNEYHETVKQLINVTLKCFKESDVHMFNDVASNAINIIFKLTDDSYHTCMILIQKCFMLMKNNEYNSSVKEKNVLTLDIDLFAKFIFIIGHIALQQHDHLENVMAKELIQNVKTKYEAIKRKTNSTNVNGNVHDNEAIEIDAINTRIRNTCDNHLVNGKGMLSKFTMHVLDGCKSNNLQLKENAINTLVKFMYVSTPFCETNMPLFLHLIENSDELTISIDLIAAFGWLIFKHPNLFEPHTDKLFGRLNDKNDEIRFSALITIIHLIRQEIIKVRSQVAGITKLLVDDNKKIKNTAKEFFAHIADKGNTLYNVISDIISILSNPEDMINENDFQEIMKILLPYIKKERQIESLVEKLCMRLKESNDDMQEYYVSYCLLNLKYTDKSLTKLSDNMSYYSEKLRNPKVYNNFNVLISANSRLAKPTTKEILSELTEKLERIVQYQEIAIPLSRKTPKQCKNTEKKKTLKSTVEKCANDKIESLQIATRASSQCCSKAKRNLLDDIEADETDE